MRISWLAFLFLGPLPLCGFAQVDRIGSLIVAEEDFARHSAEHGMRAAFLEFLSDSGVIFRPHPVNGRSAWLRRPDSPSRLSWYPEAAGVACDGQLGWTVGPWELYDSAANARPAACGHYVSIWVPDSLGRWKVVLDIGVDHDCPEEPPPRLDHESAGRTGVPSESVAGASYLKCEKEFQLLAGTTEVEAAYRKHASTDIRMLRARLMPVKGIEPLLATAARQQGRVKWKTIGESPPGERDLGYVYGDYRRSPVEGSPDQTERGYFVRVWKRGSGGVWKIVLDLETRLQAE